MADKVGFIGLGEMGMGMAKNLLNKGFDLTVYARRQSVADRLVSLGAREAGSPRDLAAVTDIVFIMVRDDAQTEDVMWGGQGVLEGIRSGSAIVITSTVSPRLCQKLAADAGKKGAGVVDSPVSGGKGGAEAGTLTLLIGGEEQLVTRLEPVFKAISSNQFHLGPVGMGQVGKLANNMVLFGSIVTTTEALAFATRAGIPKQKFLDFVNVSSGLTWVSQRWDFIAGLKKDTSPAATLNVMYKDLKLGLECAREAGVDMAVISKLRDADLFRQVI